MCVRPLTLPDFLDSKKSVNSGKFGGPKSPPYPSRGPPTHPGYGGPSQSYGIDPSSQNYGTDPLSQSYGNDIPSPLLPGHGHDYKPLRGIGGGSAGLQGGSNPSAGYSYSSLSDKNNKYNSYDDYHDGPPTSSYYNQFSSSDGPKSFVAVSGHLSGDDDPDGGVININHGNDYDSASDRPQAPHHLPSSSKNSASYKSGGGGISGRYDYQHRITDPLHPLRNYHSIEHNNEDMYTKLRQEYQTKRAKPTVSSPVSPHYSYNDDFNEPSPTSIELRHVKSDNSGSGDKAPKSKAYWRMSYTQNV